MAEFESAETIDKIEAMAIAALEPFMYGAMRTFVVPEGYRLETMDFASERAGPSRKRGKATLRDVESFVEYVKHQAGRGTTVFVDNLRLFAVLNGHEPEVVDVDANAHEIGAGWGDHTATFEPKYTPGWTAWIGFNENWIEQRAFAGFLESRISEIANPNGADVLEAVRSLRIRYDTTYERLIETSNDFVQLVYREEAETGSIKVPNKLDLKMRMFEGGEDYMLSCRVRFQKPDSSGKVKFRFELGEELHEIQLKAQQDLRDKLANGLPQIPVFVGSWSNQ